MDIKNEILTAIKEKFENNQWDPRCQTQEILEESEFFLQKAKDAYDDFIKADTDAENLNDILQAIILAKRNNGNRMITLDKIYEVFNEADMEEGFRDRLLRLMSYLIENFREKKIYNEYIENEREARDVVHVPGGPNLWILQFIEYRATMDFNSLNSTARYTIDYINDPMNEISIVSEKHRMRLSEVLLDNEKLDDKNFCAGIKEFFSTYKDVVNNPMNFTILCARMLYDKEITRIWQERTPKKRRSIYDD